MKKNATPKITMDSIRDPLENYKDVEDDYLGITKDLGLSDEKETASPQKAKRHTHEESRNANHAIRVSTKVHMTILQIQMAYSLNNQKVSAAYILENCLIQSIQSLPKEIKNKFDLLKKISEQE